VCPWLYAGIIYTFIFYLKGLTNSIHSNKSTMSTTTRSCVSSTHYSMFRQLTIQIHIHLCLVNSQYKYIYSQSHLGWHFRKLKAQSSYVSFATFQCKETFELWALSFETAFENVTPSRIGCTYMSRQLTIQIHIHICLVNSQYKYKYVIYICLVNSQYCQLITVCLVNSQYK